MSRSKWKGPYVNVKSFESFNKSDRKKSTILASRNSTIVPSFVGYTFNVYTGNSFIELPITKEMISHKFGEFAPTRKVFTFKKKRKKKR